MWLCRKIIESVFIIIFLLIYVSPSVAAKSTIILESPNSDIKAELSFENNLRISISKRDTLMISDICINLSPDGTPFDFSNIGTSNISSSKIHEKIKTVFYTQDTITDSHIFYYLPINSSWGLEFNLYDDAFAFRWKYSGISKAYIYSELLSVAKNNIDNVTIPYVNIHNPKSIEAQYRSAFQNTYNNLTFGDINPERLFYLPSLFSNEVGKILFTEVNLMDYPGLYLKKENDCLKAYFPNYPKSYKKGGEGNQEYLVSERFNYIAEISDGSVMPWRAFIFSDDDIGLMSNNTPYLLGEPSRINDISWIKPGKATWDWWHSNNIYGVDFKVGNNTRTYKYYIDFAKKYGIQYVLIDGGWYDIEKGDIYHSYKNFNLDEITAYASQNGVGVFLWVLQPHIAENIEKAAEYFHSKGVSGIKIDFLKRDDQEMNRFCYDCAEIMAHHNLMIDFHGCAKPAGLNRTFPNVLSFENVNGLEVMKWASKGYDQVTYDTYIPFIRQIAGPVDYTPGAMINATKRKYVSSFYMPMSQGTRCRQLAQYIILFSPLSMLCDSPVNYLNNLSCLEFISEVPTVWDETRILDGKIGEYIVIARRKGKNWYIGGITNWTKRSVKINLDFLNDGKYQSTLFSDGLNASFNACDYDVAKDTISASEIKIDMASGGGFAMSLKLL